MERRLAAILAADVVGYSRLMEQDEAGTFERLRALRSELFEPEIVRHHGRVFKLMGDGLLAEFGSVVDAVECAVTLQLGMAEPNAGVLPDKRIEVRIGVHCGDVIVEGEDRHGEAVNVAARLQQLAEPGGIAVSGTVADGVKQKLALRFEPRGEVRLKNIAEPLVTFRVRTDAAATPPAVVLWLARLRRRPRRLVGIGLSALVLVGIALAAAQYLRLTPQTESATSSIAVLPFENMSGDPALDYFSDGITEDIIGGLARSPDLHVTSRTSTAAYKGKPTDVREIGRALNVRYVLEGSVQKGSDAVRIIAQLIDAGSGEHVWADRFDRESRDPLALQDEVTGRVIASLAGHQGAIQKQAYHDAWGKDRANLQEYDYYLRGHSVFFQWTKEDMAKARAIFREGLVRAPVRVAEWRGLVFVNLDPDASPVEEGLGDLVRVAERFPLERFEWQDRTVYQLDFNWKNYVDNYMEGYHIPYLHPGLNRETEAKAYSVTPGDRVCTHRAPTRSGATYDGLWLWRWPNITIGIYGDGLNITRIVPYGPSQMALEIDFFFLPDAEADPEDRRRKMQWTREVVEEDFEMCRAVQKNLGTGFYEAGPLSPRHENGVAYFHDLVRRALAPDVMDEAERR